MADASGDYTYKESGVDIDRGEEFVGYIKEVSDNDSIGMFGAVLDLEKYKQDYAKPVIVSSSDGIGTKLLLANRLKKHDTIGIDLVAMCANDVICHGAKPLQFLDYYATGSLDLEKSKQIMQGIVEGCRLAGCKLVGGETAEMPKMYKGGDYDLAGFCLAIANKGEMYPKTDIIEPGDIIIGLPSSGVHSNGFSMINALLDNGSNLEGASQLEGGLERLLTPTKVYSKEVLRLIIEHPNKIKAMAHITGGGLEHNIGRVLPDNCKPDINYAEVENQTHQEFRWIQEAGKISTEEMYRVFNMGIGFAIITKTQGYQDVLKKTNNGIIIGNVTQK